MISEFRWVRIKRKSGSILLDNQHYQGALKSARDNPNEATQVAIDEIAETKEKVELELQRSQLQLLSQ